MYPDWECFFSCHKRPTVTFQLLTIVRRSRKQVAAQGRRGRGRVQGEGKRRNGGIDGAGEGTSEWTVSQKWRKAGAGEEREVCIHVGGNRGIYSSSHTWRVRERDGWERMRCIDRGDGEAFRKRARKEAERQIRGTAGGRYYWRTPLLNWQQRY